MLLTVASLLRQNFAETKDNIWIPKAYSGSYGDNGFRLTFQGTGTATTTAGNTAQTNIGDDQSGNGNNFAVTNLVASNIVLFEPGSDTSQTTSIIEYPNHSIKSNRNYQVGIVLSDRYGRTSTVILSNNKDTIIINGISYSGSTIYSPYISPAIVPSQWPGNSIKLLFNQALFSTKNTLHLNF